MKDGWLVASVYTVHCSDAAFKIAKMQEPTNVALVSIFSSISKKVSNFLAYSWNGSGNAYKAT